MKGMELSRKYFDEYGLPMLKQKFPQYIDKMAAGLAGEGSECLGFDDEYSQDHDFGAGFSNFTAILRVNPDFIKIDGDLIINCDKDPMKQLCSVG